MVVVAKYNKAMRGLRFAILLTFAMALLPAISLAQRGEREGFFVGLGVGGGGTLTNAKDSELTNGVGLTTDFKVGYGISDNLAFISTLKGAWYMNGDGLSIFSGIPAIGITYWFKPDDKSLFLTGGVGLPTLIPYGRYVYYGFYGEETTDYEPYLGVGLFCGAGVEFGKHFSIELDAHSGALFWLSNENVPILNVTTFYITFNFLFY